MSHLRGRIVKAIAGFYYVCTDDGLTRQCRARGVFKKRGIKPLVGDLVQIEPCGAQEGVVVEVEERRNELTRPTIANVDQVLLVFSLVDPALSFYQLDKMLAMVGYAGLPVILGLTKVDLPGADQVFDSVGPLYERLGYPLLSLDVLHGHHVRALKQRLTDKITVLAGLSGVGKSTILQTVIPDADTVTGEISERGHRGRHTTRHVELFEYGGGFVADTPGFSQYDFSDLEPSQLGSLFREISSISADCEFRGCNHEEEQGCAVVRAVRAGLIAPSRYANYTQMLSELRAARARRY